MAGVPAPQGDRPALRDPLGEPRVHLASIEPTARPPRGTGAGNVPRELR